MSKKEATPTKKNKGGRPKWMPTEEDISKIERLASIGYSKEHIAYTFDKNPDTIYQRINDTPEFSEAIKKGEAKAAARVTGALYAVCDEACLSIAEAVDEYKRNRIKQKMKAKKQG
jgi:DNA invertase Pin-like site-specific DNA recombinase